MANGQVQRPPVEAYDLEEFLKERDACGVSLAGLQPAVRLCTASQSMRMLLLQVGFIANLKSDKSHKVIQDVSGLPWSPLDYTLRSCAATWRPCCSRSAPSLLPVCRCDQSL